MQFCTIAKLYVTLHETNHSENMKTKLCTLLIFFITLGCTDERALWIEKAEDCMEADPKSAYWCLQQIDITTPLSEIQQARYALLSMQARHKCRMPLEDDSLITIAVHYFRRHNDVHRLAKSLLYQGLLHKQNGRVEQAVEAFAESERCFDGVDDSQYKALLFDHYGMLLSKQAMYDEALHYFKLTLHHELQGDSAHYVVSTCRRIAMLYSVCGMEDSARTYYNRGLSYADEKGVRSRNYYLMLQNYATFLKEKGNYDEAERILYECAAQLTDTAYVYTLYSSLSSLHYEKEEYDKALNYAKRILGSSDSLTISGGFLRLYYIYRKMEMLDSAVHYHDMYRQYDSDLSMRRQPARIAVIPHMQENQILKAENRNWKFRLWLWICVGGLLVVLLVYMRKRHRKEQHDSLAQLADMKQMLAETEQQLGETVVSLGGLKGVVTNQTNAINRLKEEQQQTKNEHRDELRLLRESLNLQEENYRKLKEDSRTSMMIANQYKKELKELQKNLKEKSDQLAVVNNQRELDQRINHFMMKGYDVVAIDLLLQLKYGKEYQSRFDIRPSEYLPLLRVLLAHEYPEMGTVLDQSGLERNKLTMCYLIALGLDDVSMMARAACLAPNSVKAYRKECREIVEGSKLFEQSSH